MDRRARTALGVAVAASTLAVGWRLHPLVGHPTGEPPWRPDRMGPPPPEAFATFTPPAVAAILAVCAGIVVMRWRPLAGFLLGVAGLTAYGALGGPSIGSYPAALVLSIGLLRARGLGRTLPWLALLLVALWATWWDAPDLGLTQWRMWSTIGSELVWALVPTLLVALAMARRQARAREQAEAVERAASDERLRLAREIHDVVGHSLSMISLQSGVALRVLDADPAQARTSLEAIRASSKDALAELRQTLGVFRGDPETPLAPTPTLAAIPRLVDEVRAGGVRVDLAPLPESDAVGAATQAVAYRVVQEALTNAIRHAPGERVDVVVSRTPDTLVVRVANALRQAQGPVVEGGGLRGMRERVEALGGTLGAGALQQAFVVEARLPLPHPTTGAP